MRRILFLCLLPIALKAELIENACFKFTPPTGWTLLESPLFGTNFKPKLDYQFCLQQEGKAPLYGCLILKTLTDDEFQTTLDVVEFFKQRRGRKEIKRSYKRIYHKDFNEIQFDLSEISLFKNQRTLHLESTAILKEDAKHIEGRGKRFYQSLYTRPCWNKELPKSQLFILFYSEESGEEIRNEMLSFMKKIALI